MDLCAAQVEWLLEKAVSKPPSHERPDSLTFVSVKVTHQLSLLRAVRGERRYTDNTAQAGYECAVCL